MRGETALRRNRNRAYDTVIHDMGIARDRVLYSYCLLYKCLSGSVSVRFSAGFTNWEHERTFERGVLAI